MSQCDLQRVVIGTGSIRIQVDLVKAWIEAVVSRADQDVLIQAIPHATLKTYPETGHALHWERPEEFTKDLLDFVQTNSKQK